MTKVTMRLLLVVLAGCSVRVNTRSTPSPDDARSAAQALMDHGALAWNAGDLDGFMSDYTPDATFVTPREIVHGRENIRARYAPRFRPGAVRDSLHFEGLEVDGVTEDAIHMIAFYVLQRRDSVTARGPTSLLLRKRDGRWFIAHDHSS